MASQVSGGAGAVLVHGDAGRAWGWIGVEVVAAVRPRGAPSGDSAPGTASLAADRAWLRRCWQPERDLAIEVRWSGGGGGLRCHLLGRVSAPTERDLSEPIAQLHHLLAQAPSHVVTSDIDDEGELGRLLAPFPVVAGSGAAVRKRLVAAPPRRPDAGVSYYVGVQPLLADPSAWPALLVALANAPCPTMLSVVLEPVVVDARLLTLVDRLCATYESLARPTSPSLGLHGYHSQEADLFAVDAHSWFHQASQRLRGPTFRFGARLVGASSLSPTVVAALGDVLGGAERLGQAVAAPESQGVAADLEIAVSPEAVDTLAANVASLGLARWGGHEAWTWPSPPPQILRDLTELADIDEVAALARLPPAGVDALQSLMRTVTPDAVVDHHASAAADAVMLGKSLAGDRPFRIPLSTFVEQPMLVVGAAGAGKSRAVAGLVSQLWREHAIPSLVIAASQSDISPYRELELRGEALLLTPGLNGMPLQLNPLVVSPSGDPRIQAQLVTDLVGTYLALGDVDRGDVRRALESVFIDRAQSGEGISRPRLADLVGELGAMADRSHGEGPDSTRRAALAEAVRWLLYGRPGSVLAGTRSVLAETIGTRPLVVDIAELASGPEARLIAATALSMLPHLTAAGAPSLVVVIEEAHGLFHDDRDKVLYDWLLREARSRAIGLVFVDRSPGRLLADIVNDTGVRIALRTPAAADRQAMVAAMGLDPEQDRDLANLDSQVGLVRAPGTAGAALLNLAAESPEAIPPAAKAVSPAPTTAFTGPYRACEGCVDICAHGEVSLEIAANVAVRNDFGRRIDRSPTDDTVDQWRTWHRDASTHLGAVLEAAGIADTTAGRDCLFLHCCLALWPTGDISELVANHRALRRPE